MRCFLLVLFLSAATVFALDSTSVEHASGDNSNVPHVSDDEDMAEGSGSGVGMDDDSDYNSTTVYTTMTSFPSTNEEEGEVPEEVPEEEFENIDVKKNMKKTKVIIEEVDIDIEVGFEKGRAQPKDDFIGTKYTNNEEKDSLDGPSKEEVVQASVFQSTHFLTAVIIGGGVGLVFAIVLIGLLFYRMRKKDEGSYSIDDQKKHGAPPTYQYTQGQEYYA